MVIRPAGCLRCGSKDSDLQPRPDQFRPVKANDPAHGRISRLKCLGFALVHTETINGKERIRLVTCGSRSLSPAEKLYAVVEQEALAIKYPVEKCRYYLLGMQKFTVWTDHRLLLGIWRKQIDEIGNARCQKWRENLSIYNFNVEWKAGKTHYVADSLSRAPYWDPLEVDSVFCFAIIPNAGNTRHSNRGVTRRGLQEDHRGRQQRCQHQIHRRLPPGSRPQICVGLTLRHKRPRRA
jgi:hypothetical protein